MPEDDEDFRGMCKRELVRKLFYGETITISCHLHELEAQVVTMMCMWLTSALTLATPKKRLIAHLLS